MLTNNQHKIINQVAQVNQVEPLDLLSAVLDITRALTYKPMPHEIRNIAEDEAKALKNKRKPPPGTYQNKMVVNSSSNHVNYLKREAGKKRNIKMFEREKFDTRSRDMSD